MTSRLVQPYTPPQQTPPVSTAAPSTGTPLDQKTAFRTKGGLHLLFEPDAMDAWIARSIATNEEGDYVDAQTGETLGAVEKADYVRYRRRLGERRRVGKQADHLVRIVDKYLPKVAAENRAYVMKYPQKVGGMLKKAGALRKRLQAKKMHKKGKMAAKEERGSPELPEPLVTKETRDTAATGPTEPSELGHTERAQDQRGERLPHATSEASVREVTPPDWGDEEEDSNPEVSDQEGTAQWPWGPAGRPSDQEEGQRKPNEPTGKPPR